MAGSGNYPKRRIARYGDIDRRDLNRLLDEARYTGSAHHKRAPMDYNFDPPVNPRPYKSLCDGGRIVRLVEARKLFREGVRRGMVSSYWGNGFPKYVWAVDSKGRAFESKIEHGTSNYHGYELDANDEDMRRQVIDEWNRRC